MIANAGQKKFPFSLWKKVLLNKHKVYVIFQCNELIFDEFYN